MPADDLLHTAAASGELNSVLVSAAETPPIERSKEAPQPAEPRPFSENPTPMPGLFGNGGSREGNGSEQRYAQRPRDGNPSGNGGGARSSGAPGAGSHNNAEARRTLHLSLSQGNGGPHNPERAPLQNVQNPTGFVPPSRPQGGPQSLGPPARQMPGSSAPPPNFPPASGRGKESAAFIDHALRERVDEDIAAFLAAFDAALDHDTAESRTGLREATDRLLRVGARTRIELERLEARAPLPPRDNIGHSAPLFRR